MPSGVRSVNGAEREHEGGGTVDRSPRWIYWLVQGSMNEREKEREEGNPTYSVPLKKIDSYLFPDLVFRNKEWRSVITISKFRDRKRKRIGALVKSRSISTRFRINSFLLNGAHKYIKG